MKKPYFDPEQADLSKYEANLTYDESRKLDLVRQVLNENSNFMEEKNNIVELMAVYDKVLAKEKMPRFSQSMKNSMDGFQVKSKIVSHLNDLKAKDSQSFLIVPLMSNDHVFGAVFRKTDEGFVATIVNKGGRPFTQQFVEYKIKEENIEKLITQVRDNFGKTSIPSVYKYFNDNAYLITKLNVKSKDQKVGNCFIKEPENCIKFAFATRNFKEQDFEDLTNGNIKNFHPKWDMMTVNMHREFATRVAIENPNISKQIKNEIETYANNKTFREYMERGIDIDKCLSLAFDPADKSLSLPDADRYRKYLEQINTDTLSRRPFVKIITEKIEAIGDVSLIQDFKDLKKQYEATRSSYGSYGVKPADKVKELNRLGKIFPVAVKLIKYELQGNFMGDALNAFNSATRYNNESSIITFFEQIDAGISSHPTHFNHHVLRGAFNVQIAQEGKDSISEAIKDLTTAIKLKDNHACSYYLRSLAYEKASNSLNSKKDLEKAMALDKPGVERWQAMKPYEVFCDYFACYEGKNRIIKSIEKQEIKDAFIGILEPKSLVSKVAAFNFSNEPKNTEINSRM